MLQLDLFREAEQTGASTFLPNLKLPVHRWFRYSAGFSAQWVKSVLRRTDATHSLVLDPFAGAGTTLIACDECGVQSIGLEAQPFAFRVAKAKLKWASDSTPFREMAKRIIDLAGKWDGQVSIEHPELMHRCFTPSVLHELYALTAALRATEIDTPEWHLCWLAFVSIIRSCSHVGTAPWQYVLPKKTKARVEEPVIAFKGQVRRMLSDMEVLRHTLPASRAEIFEADARKCEPVEDSSVDLVITSPPYANNYDYADATRLEMMLLGEIQGWGELHTKIRSRLVRSCSQHVSADRLSPAQSLDSIILRPIIDELQSVCQKLEEVKHGHGGKKSYDAMVAAYFLDIAQVFHALRRVCTQNSVVAFVIGDSAPYGVHVPTERWLGELAISAGFESWSFEKWRDRNMKWKNRKHRVPLQEGALWVRG